MKNNIGSGDVISVTSPGVVKSGDLVIVGMLSGVAQHDAGAGDPVEIAPRGTFYLKKVAGTAWAAGAALYADPSTGALDVAKAEGTLFVGAALADATSAATEGAVYLNGVAPASLVPSAGG